MINRKALETTERVTETGVTLGVSVRLTCEQRIDAENLASMRETQGAIDAVKQSIRRGLWQAIYGDLVGPIAELKHLAAQTRGSFPAKSEDAAFTAVVKKLNDLLNPERFL